MMISCVNGRTKIILQMLFIPFLCSKLFHLMFSPSVVFIFGCPDASTHKYPILSKKKPKNNFAICIFLQWAAARLQWDWWNNASHFYYLPFFFRTSSVNDISYSNQFDAGKKLFKILPVEDLITARLLDIWVHRQVFNVTCSSPTISVFLNNSGRMEE